MRYLWTIVHFAVHGWDPIMPAIGNPPDNAFHAVPRSYHCMTEVVFSDFLVIK